MADVNGYRFGVCNRLYNSIYNANDIYDLEVFEDYESAYKCYISRLDIEDNPRYIYPDLWIVWIREDNKIEQWEQLSWHTECKIIDLTNHL